MMGDFSTPEPGTPIDLFVIDLRPINAGEPLVRYCAGVNDVGGDIVFNGNTYLRWPIQMEDMEVRADGSMSRPQLVVGNLGGVFSTLNLQYDDIIGAKITRIRTMRKYLDAVNFTGGVNADADPLEYVQQRFVVHQLRAQDAVTCTYELAAAHDLEGVTIPRRTVARNYCQWSYRDANCGYSGPDVADSFDRPVGDPDYDGTDQCSYRLAGCRLRFGDSGPLPFGGFPSVARG